MKALIYNGAGKYSWQDAPDPDLIDPTDAIVRGDAVTICGEGVRRAASSRSWRRPTASAWTWRSRRSASPRPSNCTNLVRPGGHVADVGVHGKLVVLHLEDLWIKDVTITVGLVDTSSTSTLLRMTAAGRFDTGAFFTTASDWSRCRRRTTSSRAPVRPAR